jgi:hypothetical protein
MVQFAQLAAGGTACGLSAEGVATFVMIALWLGGTGMIGAETAGLFLLGLPALALGTWAGLKLFGRLNEAGFRRVVLVLLLFSGEPTVQDRVEPRPTGRLRLGNRQRLSG